MPLTPRRAAGWRPRGTPALPGWQRQGLRAERAGGRRRARLRLRRGAPCAPGGARLGPLPAPARARRALSGHAGHPAAGAQALRRWGARLGSCTCPGQPGGCGRERWGCMRFARARAKGEGAARPRRLGRPRAPRPERAPGRRLCPPVAGRGSREGRRRPPQVCRGAPAAAAREASVRSRVPGKSRTAAPGRSAQARARRHTRKHWLAPPQPASRCDRSPATRSKNLP